MKTIPRRQNSCEGKRVRMFTMYPHAVGKGQNKNVLKNPNTARSNWNSHMWPWRGKWVKALWKTLWQYVEKQLYVTYNPAITLLGVHSKRLSTDFYQKTFTRMIIADLFIMDANWKQSTFPSTVHWINKIVKQSNIIQQWKQTAANCMQWTSQTTHWMKEARHKRTFRHHLLPLI